MDSVIITKSTFVQHNNQYNHSASSSAKLFQGQPMDVSEIKWLSIWCTRYLYPSYMIYHHQWLSMHKVLISVISSSSLSLLPKPNLIAIVRSQLSSSSTSSSSSSVSSHSSFSASRCENVKIKSLWFSDSPSTLQRFFFLKIPRF